MKKIIRIALDGPSGAGKSSLAIAIAKQLGILYVDTGALYRAIGLYCIQHDIDIDDPTAVASALADVNIRLENTGEQHIFLNDTDVSQEIRVHEVSQAASKVSSYPVVREFLLDLQRSTAEHDSVVMDGRDIGTVILPHAEYKFFVTASPEERARRRVKQLKEKGQSVAFDQVLNDIKERDYRDSHRAHSPLKQADDAHLIDTTDLTFDEALNTILKIIKDKK